MKVKVKASIHDYGHTKSHNYELAVKPPIPCCASMGEHWAEDDFALETEKDAAVVKVAFYHSDYDGYNRDEFTVAFCPFCGEKIEVVVVDTVELTPRIKQVTRTVTHEETVWEPKP